MEGIYFTGLRLQNYKCFDDRRLDFAVPDGSTPGSGLTVLIGENGNGKTAILEALNYLSSSTFAAENRLRINDFGDPDQPITLTADTTPFTCSVPLPWRGTFDCHGIEFTAKSREQKSRGRLLSPPYQINARVRPSQDDYTKPSGDSGGDIPPISTSWGSASIKGPGLNATYFDKNRSRQLSPGTFKTQFERICDDLNWKFLKNLGDDDREQLLDSITGPYFEKVLDIAQRGTGKKLGQEMQTFFDQDQFKDLGIDIVNLLHPFANAFFALRRDGEFTQISPRDMGSGVEIVLTLLLLRSLTDAKGGIVYLLDEPELHLHPKAQLKLLELLFVESTDRQIIIATHSPYVIKGCMSSDVRKIILKRDGTGALSIEAAAQPWATFPWGPTWGEVNFVAYDLPTVEFHNELYGYLQESQKLASIRDVETFLTAGGEPQPLQWIRQNPGGAPQPPEPITLCSYVRNSIHHPENTNNPPFTDDQLRESIETLRRYV